MGLKSAMFIGRSTYVIDLGPILFLLSAVSSIVLLSVSSSPIAVGFGSSFQLLSRGFSFRHDGGKGSRWKREKEGEEAGKHALLTKLQV